jgi:hypothetical protein
MIRAMADDEQGGLDPPEGTSGGPSICGACARLIGTERFEGGHFALVCEAFPGPDGIPIPIRQGYDHRRPYPDDGGLMFVLAPGEEAEAHLAAYSEQLAVDPRAADYVPPQPFHEGA